MSRISDEEWENSDGCYLADIGCKLAAARKIRKISQKQAADALGTSQSTISNLERGERTTSVVHIIELIKLYGVSYEEIFGKNDGNLHITDFSDVKTADCGEKLLEMLTEKADSQLIDETVEMYLKICIYKIFRTIYSQNPNNSGAPFSIEYTKAIEKANRFITTKPDELARHIKIRRGIKAKLLEVPLSMNERLKIFIADCEGVLKGIF